MPLELAPGDRVNLTPAAIALYGGVWGKYTPEGQGGGKSGTVIEANAKRLHDPRAAFRPYLVRWDNGVVNSYREGDLQASDESQPEPNVFEFKR